MALRAEGTVASTAVDVGEQVKPVPCPTATPEALAATVRQVEALDRGTGATHVVDAGPTFLPGINPTPVP